MSDLTNHLAPLPTPVSLQDEQLALLEERVKNLTQSLLTNQASMVLLVAQIEKALLGRSPAAPTATQCPEESGESQLQGNTPLYAPPAPQATPLCLGELTQTQYAICDSCLGDVSLPAPAILAAPSHSEEPSQTQYAIRDSCPVEVPLFVPQPTRLVAKLRPAPPPLFNGNRTQG